MCVGGGREVGECVCLLTCYMMNFILVAKITVVLMHTFVHAYLVSYMYFESVERLTLWFTVLCFSQVCRKCIHFYVADSFYHHFCIM